MKRLGALALLLCCGVVAAWADDLLPSEQYDTVVKTATSTSPVSASTLWTPASGKRIILQGFIACAQAPATGVELLGNAVDILPPFGIESYGCKTFGGGGAPLWMGGTDQTITYSVTAGSSVSVMAYGYETHP